MEKLVKVAVVFGSSRANGNTFQVIDSLRNFIDFDLYSLDQFNISEYDYEHKNKDDDFLFLINKLISYDHIIFASPVYWYTMSAKLKVFIDRLSDLLTIAKDLGFALKGKSCSLLATGVDDDLVNCFQDSFCMTFNYLSMHYKGYLYCRCDDKFFISEHHNKIENYTNGIVT